MASPSVSSSLSPDRCIQVLRDHKTRKKYRDRKKSIFKKAEELSILCDVDIAVILYNKEAAAAETWPQDPTQINRIVKKYKAKTQLLNASTSHNASSPSPSIPKKRKDTSLDLSVTLEKDGGDDFKKLKLKADDDDDDDEDEDDDKNSQEACREKQLQYYEFPILWQRSDEVDVLHEEDVSRIVDDDDDYEVKLASLEAKRQVIMKRIALLEATSLCL